MKNGFVPVIVVLCLIGCGGDPSHPLGGDPSHPPESPPPPNEGTAEFVSKVSSPMWPISGWSEDGLHVGKNGSDRSDCGLRQSPCLTIKFALTRAKPGDTVFVHNGLYVENGITPPSNVRLLSADGPLSAKIFSGVKRGLYISKVNQVEIDGFEIYGLHNGGTSRQDGLIRIWDAQKIVIRNTLAHDAPIDADVIKISSGTSRVEDILLDTVIAYNTADPTEEVVDIFGSAPMVPPSVRNVVMRNSWILDGQHPSTYLTYAKVNVENILYDGNVFGPFQGVVYGDTALSIGTIGLNNVDASQYANRHTVVRNNIFIKCAGEGALGITNTDDAWVYNNIFYQNSGSTTDSVILLDGVEMSPGKVLIFNNVFFNNFPSSRKHGKLYWVRKNGMPRNLIHENNLYFNNTLSTDVEYTSERGSYYVAPLFQSTPILPDTFNGDFHPTLETLAQLIKSFRISVDSPTKGKGRNVVSQEPGPYPNWFAGLTDVWWNILHLPRSDSGPWDLGPF